LAYYVDHLSLHKEGEQIRMKSIATAGSIFKMVMGNLLIVIFTLGLGYAWAVTRTMNFMTANIKLEGNMDLNTIQQTEDDYNDATGDDMTGLLDINFII